MVKTILSLLFAAGLGTSAPLKHKMNMTPILSDDLVKVMEESYANVYGEKGDLGVIAGAWAHVSLENKRGERVWNNNLGNIGKLPQDPPAPYYSHFGKSNFLSFKTRIQGAEHYWRFMQKRCPLALRYFKLKRPGEAALSLKRCNYYRTSERHYVKILTALYGEGIKRASSKSRR